MNAGEFTLTVRVKYSDGQSRYVDIEPSQLTAYNSMRKNHQLFWMLDDDEPESVISDITVSIDNGRSEGYRSLIYGE